jgi:flotillin
MCFDMGVVTCGPNEALIISGMFFGPEPSMIVGGRALVCPCIQRVQRIPLSTMTLVVQSPRVYTSQGVPISVTGVAQVSVIFNCWPRIRVLMLKVFFPCSGQDQWV